MAALWFEPAHRYGRSLRFRLDVGESSDEIRQQNDAGLCQALEDVFDMALKREG